VHPQAVAGKINKPGMIQVPQMPGSLGLSEAQTTDKVAYAEFPTIVEYSHYLEPGFLGQSLQCLDDFVHW